MNGLVCWKGSKEVFELNSFLINFSRELEGSEFITNLNTLKCPWEFTPEASSRVHWMETDEHAFKMRKKFSTSCLL